MIKYILDFLTRLLIGTLFVTSAIVSPIWLKFMLCMFGFMTIDFYKKTKYFD